MTDYDEAQVLARLTALQEALATARGSTDLDPFDEALANAVNYMLDLSKAQAQAGAAQRRADRRRRLGLK